MTVFPSAGGSQETFCLRLDLVHGWLFTIDESRVKDEETRQRVLSYKRECYAVLFRHFHGATKVAPGPVDDREPSVSPPQKESFRVRQLMVAEATTSAPSPEHGSIKAWSLTRWRSERVAARSR